MDSPNLTEIRSSPKPATSRHRRADTDGTSDRAADTHVGTRIDKRFCLTFTATLSLMIACWLVIHVAVDPYANFGTDLFQPLTSSVRRDKTRSLEQLEVRPEALIIGSSRVMKIEPLYIQQRTGLRTFNLGVSSAMAEDYYALLKYSLDLGLPLKTIFLGVDDEAFSSGTGIDPRLLKQSHLARYLAERNRFQTTVDSLYQAFSYQAIDDTLKCFRLNVNGFPPESNQFDSQNGFVTYVQWETQIERGEFDLASQIESSKARYLERFANYDQLADWRCDYFRRFVDLCKDHHIQLHCFVTPLHPEIENILERERDLENRREELIEFLASFKDDVRIEFVDTSDLSYFDGLATEFYDGAHASEVNLRKLIDKVLSSGSSHSADAVQ